MTQIKFDAIIFDFDGVITESLDVKTVALMKLYEPYGIEIVQQVKRYHLENGGMSRFEKFRYFHNILLCRDFNEQIEWELAGKFSRMVEDGVVNAPLVEGALEFLQEFSTQLPLFVASGTPEDELCRITIKKGLNQYFVSLHGSPQSKVDIINRIVKDHNLEQSRVLMVGDAMQDYTAAMQTSVNFVWRVSNTQIVPPDDVETIKNLYELKGLVFS